MEHLPYNDYGRAMRKLFGGRVQKLAIDAGLGCPNRDGTIGYGGCTFCLGEAFSPSYCREHPSIHSQIDAALQFHAQRGRRADFHLAYFQSGTNTHASLDILERLYNEAIKHPAIAGIIIGTRPDCINSETLQLLHHISHSKYVAIEYGIESTFDHTLQHVNRGHNFAAATHAVEQTKALGIAVGAHFILGLPNETRDDIFESIHHINALELDFIKFHQLQIYTNTVMAKEWEAHPERFLFSQNTNTEDYINIIVDIIRRLRANTAIERFASQAPRHLVMHSPLNGIRLDELRNRIVARLHSLQAKQGDYQSLHLSKK